MNAKRAFTILELTLALTIMSLVGLSIAAVASALSNASASTAATYDAIQTSRTAMAQVQHAVRKARLITGYSESSLLLWAEDTDGNGSISNDELVLISLDSSKKQLVRHKMAYPDYLGQSVIRLLSPVMQLTDAMSLSSVSSLLKTSAYGKAEILACDVSEFRVTSNNAAPEATLIVIDMTVGSGNDSIKLRSASTMRLDYTDRLRKTGHTYYLTAPGQ